MSAPVALWDSILLLTTGDKLTRENVERATGSVLVPDMAHSNDFFSVYRSDDPEEPSSFAAVELREPKEGATAKGPLLILRVREGAEIELDFIKEKMKRQPRIIEPDPRQKSGALRYHEYPMRKGKLRFGFTTDAVRRLRSVVIDRT